MGYKIIVIAFFLIFAKSFEFSWFTTEKYLVAIGQNSSFYNDSIDK